MREFNLNDTIKITLNGKSGRIVGKATYTYLPSSYMVSYLDGNNDAAKDWFDVSELSSIQ